MSNRKLFTTLAILVGLFVVFAYSTIYFGVELFFELLKL